MGKEMPYILQGDEASLGPLDSLNGLHTNKVLAFLRLPGAEEPQEPLSLCPSPPGRGKGQTQAP